MDGLAVTELPGVVAPLNFLSATSEKPVSYNYEPPAGVPVRTGTFEEHRVTVHDARAIADRLTLDHQGFVLVKHPTAASDLYDEAQIRDIYYPEIERRMLQATGARRVVVFDHIVRNAAKAETKGSGVKLPAARVHNDYTAKSAPQRVRDLLGDEAEELLQHRYAVINAWRPIRGPLLRSPLALCDAESLEQKNLIQSDLLYPDRVGEIYAVTYNPGQRWYYFPKMQADEIVLIRCFDSAREGAARFSAHGAFEDPQTPPNAPPRESIEVRTLVFY